VRVLRLRILNLNSLAGDFTIDFTHPAYWGGVFAITGPTGAGKTTILDAICLALYGRTPRLPRVNKSGNEIMSRSRGECAAEITFETPAGRWRASWAQRRARLKAGGALQDPQHEIAEEGGRILESQLSRTAARVAALTGLTFEQFTRASLLAQGAFAAFLAAPADDKAALLEQITGTALYRDISIRVHLRRAEERRRLEDLEKAGALLAAPDEDEAGLKRQRADLAGRLDSLERELAEGTAARAWLESLAGLEAERERLAAKEKELAGRRQAFTPLAERLGRANLALPLAPLGAELALLRKQRAAALQGLLGAETGQEPGTALAALGRELEGTRDRLAELLRGRDLAALRAEGRAGQRRAGELAALKRDWAEARRLRRDRAEAEARLAQARDQAREAAAEIRLAEARLTELAAESARLAKVLEEAKLRRGLADWRGELEPGRPCPLCGALEHPWADLGRGPEPDSDEAGRSETALEAGRREAAKAAAREAALNQAALDLEEQARRLGREEERRARGLAERAAALGLDLDRPEEGRDRLAEAERKAAELEGRLGEAEGLAGSAERLAIKIKDFKAALDRASALEEEIAKRAGAFRLALAEAGLDGEEAFEAARLPEDERLDLERRARDMEAASAALATAAKDNADRLLAERARNLTARTRPELEALLAGLAETRRELQGALGALDHRLGEVAALAARRLAWRGEVAARREEARRWENLHELIGSADGKKYRAFAQGLTFESLIAQANRQLTSLSDRYLLARDPAQGGLELSVIDLWQAGEIRSTKNLSGGESFLVSLALALGLARLSSRKARVDSLFLDEGFGALDEETLETVLNTLSGLNQDGRLVGVISHVPALRDRLTTQIRLIPSAGGPYSRISGPGVFLTGG